MKHTLFKYIYGIVLLILSSQITHAQQAFYIYRNDGVINTFYTEYIDSIKYSKVDTSGIEHDEYVSKEIYTTDSCYTIPIALIDSVGFVTPETVYQPGVVVIEGELRQYVVKCDTLVITFSMSTPQNLLPHKGDRLVTMEVDEIIPRPFIGEVTSINNTTEGIEMTCVPCSLTDVFETYYGITRNNPEVSSAKTRGIADGYYATNGTIKPGKLSVDILNTHKFGLQYTPSDEFAFGIGNAQASMSLTPTIDYRTSLIINKSHGVNVSVMVIGEYDTEQYLALSGFVNMGGDADLFTKAIPVPNALIDIYIKLGAFCTMNGEISTEQTWTQKYRSAFYWEWSSKGHESLKKVNEVIPISSNHTGKVALKGSWKGGVFGEIGVAFIATTSLDIANVGIRLEGGIAAEGTFVPYKKDLEYARTSTDLYNQIKDATIDSYLYYGTSFTANLFKWSINKEIPNFKNIPFSNKGLISSLRAVPLFAETKLERGYDGALEASAKVAGIVRKTDLGFALINDDDPDDAIYSYTFHGYNGPSANMSATFFDVSKDGNYTLYPLVKYMDMELIAEPKVKANQMCVDHNHPHMIDLGLPSGTKWACCNVGASSPEGFGGYYAWGETEKKSDYSVNTYKYVVDLDGDGNYRDNSNNWINIGSNISGTQYDVAHVKWGGSWRMPTFDEIKELVNKCSWKWTTYNGVKGQLVTGPNGNSIFLPAAGYRGGTSGGVGGYSDYWSATQGESDSSGAYYLYFSSYGYYWHSDCRYFGRPVRPVSD